MQLLVEITDATKVSYGFQMTARMGSGDTTQAGDFSNIDPNPDTSLTQTRCLDGSTKPNGSSCDSHFPVQWIEHTGNGYQASLHNGPFTYTVNWTPPSTASGPITFYAAGNAGTGTKNQLGTNVYTTKLTLTPAAATANPPTIDPGGVVPVYSSSSTIQAGSWVSIYSFTGKNLSSGTTIWNGDFPTTLGDVTVTIDGKKAYLWFVSPSQINLQVPDDTKTGAVQVVVQNPNGSATANVTLDQAGPAFLLLGDGKHATGLIFTPQGGGSQGGGTYDFVGPTSTGTGFRPVKRGEPLVLYGVGFGPTNPAVPAGQIFTGAANMVTPPVITLGGVPVSLQFSGIVGAGLYQFNFNVPANVATGDQTLSAIVNGITTPSGIVVSVQ